MRNGRAIRRVETDPCPVLALGKTKRPGSFLPRRRDLGLTMTKRNFILGNVLAIGRQRKTIAIALTKACFQFEMKAQVDDRLGSMHRPTRSMEHPSNRDPASMLQRCCEYISREKSRLYYRTS